MTGFGGNPGEGGSGMLRDREESLMEHHVVTSRAAGLMRTTEGRPSWDDYFMALARVVSTRGDCTRRQVGCVIVDQDHRVIATGYNGAEPGGPSCLAGQCPRGLTNAPRTEDYSNCVAIHAEANALLFARASAVGSTVYVSSEICDGCAKLLRGAGVVRTVDLRNGVPRETVR